MPRQLLDFEFDYSSVATVVCADWIRLPRSQPQLPQGRSAFLHAWHTSLHARHPVIQPKPLRGRFARLDTGSHGWRVAGMCCMGCAGTLAY